MKCSTGGGQIGSEELRPFEGLVLSTARMFASQVGWEEDDLAQMLRVKVWQAIVKYDPTRSSLSLERYVFGLVTNRVKDFKRDASREMKRRQENGIAFLHIEDFHRRSNSLDRQEEFDGRYNFVEREEVYGAIEEGKFVLPASVTERETSVLFLLATEVSKTEIALRLGIAKPVLYECIASLRVKFADWAPSNASRVVELSTVQTTAEDQLVRSAA